MSSNQDAKTALAAFAAAFDRHLRCGARPLPGRVEPWSNEEFAGKIPSARSKTDYVSPRSVANWRKGSALPDRIEPILAALFGRDPNRWQDERERLLHAFREARKEKYDADLSNPAGQRYVPEVGAADAGTDQGPHMVADRSRSPSDAAAAAELLQRQLHDGVARLAGRLGAAAGRLRNTQEWSELAATAVRLESMTRGPPDALIGELGHAYVVMQQLVGFIDLDDDIRADPTLSAARLDPDIRAALSLVVRTAAPYLRRYPSIVALDQAAGSMLTRPDLFEPARVLTKLARDRRVLVDRDALDLDKLAALAGGAGRPAQKAGNHAIASVYNLLLATLEYLAAELAGPAAQPGSPRAALVDRLCGMLADGAAQVDAFAAAFQRDLGEAARAMVLEAVARDRGAAMATTEACAATPLTAAMRRRADPPAGKDWASLRGEDRFGRWAELTVSTEHGIARQRLRWIPPGRFWMGSPVDEIGRWNDEGPRHEVVITRGFWIFDTCCTQAFWQAVMGANPSYFIGAERPVDSVSWTLAQTFLAKIESDCAGPPFALPSEAQWEYACRAGTNSAFSFGDTVTADQVNYYADGVAGKYRRETISVGTLPCNPWGLYEMHGNVWEWCADGKRQYEARTAADPTGPTIGAGPRVVRGGSWSNDARYFRSANRGANDPGISCDDYGFRCVVLHDA
jgi:formylglycine-generating enzyme required for sulfatase activity